LAGRCYQRESVPFRALDPLIDQLSSFWKRLSRAEAMFLLPREPEFLLQAFPVLGRGTVVTDMATEPAPEITPHQALNRSLSSCKETVQGLSRRRPLILCLDDVQWIDPDSVRLLEFLIDANDPPVALVVLVSRPLSSDAPARNLLAPLLEFARTLDVGPLP